MKTIHQRSRLNPSLPGLHWDTGYLPDIGGNFLHGLSIIIYLEAIV
jgi:hypothetical protein